MVENKKIIEAILILAECIDELEWKTSGVQRKKPKEFRTRKELIEEILKS